MSYQKLRVRSGSDGFTPIKNAKSERIGAVYKECYYRGKSFCSSCTDN